MTPKSVSNKSRALHSTSVSNGGVLTGKRGYTMNLKYFLTAVALCCLTFFVHGTAQALSVHVGDTSGTPGESDVVVYISVEDAAGLAGGDLTLTYDASALEAKGVTAGSLATTAGITAIGNIATAGQVKISLAGATGITSDSGILVTIAFDVVSGATLGTSVLELTRAILLNEQALTIPLENVFNGTFTVNDSTSPGDGIKVKVADASGSPGDTDISVSIAVENGTGLAAGDLTLTYDGSALVAKSVSAGPLVANSSITVVSNIAAIGQVRIAMAGATGTSSESGVLATINFDVNLDAAPGAYK